MDEPTNGLLHPVQTISWAAAVVCSAIVTVIFFYSTFQTQSDSNKTEDRILKRLERIELKVDHIIEQQ